LLIYRSCRIAAVEFAPVPDVKTLVIAAVEMPNLKNVAPVERRERIRKVVSPNATSNK